MYVLILNARQDSPNSGPEHGARGENMSDDKIKIKDLCGNISQDSKDVLRAARELGLPVKSATGSVTSEEATRLRDYFAEQKQVDAERTGSHPSVIVRRRRKDSPQEAESAVQEAPVAAPVELDAPKDKAPVTEPVASDRWLGSRRAPPWVVLLITGTFRRARTARLRCGRLQRPLASRPSIRSRPLPAASAG